MPLTQADFKYANILTIINPSIYRYYYNNIIYIYKS
jgi:hypothetical protein